MKQASMKFEIYHLNQLPKWFFNFIKISLSFGKCPFGFQEHFPLFKVLSGNTAKRI